MEAMKKRVKKMIKFINENGGFQKIIFFGNFNEIKCRKYLFGTDQLFEIEQTIMSLFEDMRDRYKISSNIHIGDYPIETFFLYKQHQYDQYKNMKKKYRSKKQFHRMLLNVSTEYFNSLNARGTTCGVYFSLISNMIRILNLKKADGTIPQLNIRHKRIIDDRINKVKL